MGKGSGAFFLELKEKNIDIKALEDLMSTFDPYSENPFQGVSLSHLAHELQVSEEQARTGLRTLKAFEYCSEYSLLSEEAHQEARQAIVSTLTECDEFSNYIEGVDFQQMANETVKRVAESYPQLEAVIRLTLRDISRQGRKDDNIEIDFVKVATFVAHQLFAKRSEWSCDDLLREWQSKVPGVGEGYQVSADLLKGLAIRNGNKWRYLPADKIAKAPKERFEQLFSSKEKWTMDDMIPYLEIFGKRKDEMLQKFAVLVTDQIGSETITSYVKNDNAK
jgi:sister chromatid cohesion protein DCC1